MKIEPLPPSSDLLEFVDDQCIEGGQREDWQEPLVAMKVVIMMMLMLISDHLDSETIMYR